LLLCSLQFASEAQVFKTFEFQALWPDSGSHFSNFRVPVPVDKLEGRSEPSYHLWPL
jgi:hypothetical protein